MSPRKYPLQALAQARGYGVDAATRSLAEAVRVREGAAETRQVAQARKDDHERGTRVVKAAERASLEKGDLRASDLARADAWAVRAAVERDALAAGLEQARAAEAKASDALSGAQRRVAERRAEAGVVDKHRARWDAARRATVEAAEEEASGEAWRPKG